MKILSEIIKRKNSKNDVNAVVGVEIKNRRIALQRTLLSVSYKICSISYLCKLENNRILGNTLYVGEICDRVDLTKDKIDVLLNLKKILVGVVEAFIAGDIDYLKKAVIDGEGLNNYRYQIIQMVYYIAVFDLYNASILYNQILKLVSSLTDFDLNVMCLFSSIFLYLDSNFNDARELLHSIGYQNDENAELLRKIYILYCDIALDYKEALLDYNELIMDINMAGKHFLLDQINYPMAMYSIKNGFSLKNKYINQIMDQKLKKSAIFMDLYIRNEKIKLSDFPDNKINDSCRILKIIMKDKAKAKEEIDKLSLNYYRCDISIEFLKYQVIEDINEKADYIIDIVIPTIKRTEEAALGRFFLKELLRISSQSFKYKQFYHAYEELGNLL